MIPAHQPARVGTWQGTCRACGRTDAHPVTEKSGQRVVNCINCGKYIRNARENEVVCSGQPAPVTGNDLVREITRPDVTGKWKTRTLTQREQLIFDHTSRVLSLEEGDYTDEMIKRATSNARMFVDCFLADLANGGS